MTPEALEKIENYLLGAMSEKEATQFENELQDSPALRNQVAEMKALILGIQETSVKEQMQQFHSSMQQPAGHDITKKTGKTIPLPFKKTFLMAASILFIICIGTLWYLQSGSSHQKLYSNYYRPDPGLMTVMSGAASDYDFEKAMVEYKAGEYDKALAAWKLKLKNSPVNDTLWYFIGAAYQAQEQFDSAKKYLQAVARNPKSIFQKEASWYLGLIYLQQGDKEQAIQFINQSEHHQKEKFINAIEPKP